MVTTLFQIVSDTIYRRPFVDHRLNIYRYNKFLPECISPYGNLLFLIIFREHKNQDARAELYRKCQAQNLLFRRMKRRDTAHFKLFHKIVKFDRAIKL